MNTRLEGKVALVTGASRGIGRQIATELAHQGATVVAAARSVEALENLAEEFDGRVVSGQFDLEDISSVDNLFTNIKKNLGRLDILVNNAGMGIYGKISEFAISDFDRVMSVNLRGTFACCQQAMKIMVPQKSGYIINISSVVGIKGYPNQGAYTASKHGLMGLTKTLAVEAQPHGIRVSAILPGGVDTEMVAQARPDLDRTILIQKKDVALTVSYLLALSKQAHVDQIYIRRTTGTPF